MPGTGPGMTVRAREWRSFHSSGLRNTPRTTWPFPVSSGGGFSPYAYAVNPDYDAGVFERPPTVEAGRDAWRRRGAP